MHLQHRRGGRRTIAALSQRQRRCIHGECHHRKAYGANGARFGEFAIEREFRRGFHIATACMPAKIGREQSLRRGQAATDDTESGECAGIGDGADQVGKIAAKKWSRHATDGASAGDDCHCRCAFVLGSRGVDGGKAVILTEGAKNAEKIKCRKSGSQNLQQPVLRRKPSRRRRRHRP
jgi:hypothetical protein